MLVESSTYCRGHLKARLIGDGLKKPVCEMCGLGELWHGRPLSLILDHVNGIRDDHRLNNLRIVCPNCVATLGTHCGRQTRVAKAERHCARCESPFRARSSMQRYCSRECGTRWDRRARPQPGGRRVFRPPLEQLTEEIDRLGYCGVGRHYGVSDNAIRKWVAQYQREAEAGADD